MPDQNNLPNVDRPAADRRVVNAGMHRIAHQDILMKLQQASGNGSRGLVEIYRMEVLPARTRTIRLLGRKVSARIIHTLLGFEVKASSKRIHCPDMVTARYLKLFTELGCRSIRLPYDPTLTARLLPELESAIERVSSGVRQLFPEKRDLQLYVIRQLYGYLRRQVQKS
jgi:hypothetical protein